MKRATITIIFTIFLSIIGAIIALVIQFKGQSSISTACSYLDPITIDIAAFIIALFLIIEGIYRIYEHLNFSLNKQITRSIRIAIGVCIATLHILQFIHK
jgi:hypothetical protein